MNHSTNLFADDTTFKDNYTYYYGDYEENFNLICYKNGRFSFQAKKIVSSTNDTWGPSGTTFLLNYEGTYNIDKKEIETLILNLNTEDLRFEKENFGCNCETNQTKINRQESKTIKFSSIKWANKFGFSKELNIPEQLQWENEFEKIIFDEDSFILGCLEQVGIYEFNQQAVDILKKNQGNLIKTFNELFPQVLEKKQLLLNTIPTKFHPRGGINLKENLIILKANLNLIQALNNFDSYYFGDLVDYEDWCNKNHGISDQIEIIKLYYSSFYMYQELIDPKRFPNRKELLHNDYVNLISYYNLTVPFGKYTEEKIIDRMFYFYNTKNEIYENCLIYEMTGDKVLAFRKFIKRFTDEDLRRRAIFACKHFTPSIINNFNLALLDNLEIIISDKETYDSFKYLFIILLNSDFSDYYQLNDFLKSYFECKNILSVAFEKSCDQYYFDKYFNIFKYPISQEQFILMCNSGYRYTDIYVKDLTDDFNMFAKKNLSIEQSIQILSEISLNNNLHYDHNQRVGIQGKILAINEYYFNTRKTYLKKAQDLKTKYPNACKFSSNVPFYLLIKFSGDTQQVEAYLSDKV